MESPRFVIDPESSDSIALFVDTKFTMGSKAAAEVKAYYGGVDWLRNQGATVGQIITVHQPRKDHPDEPLYVYYLVVKRGGTALPEDITNCLNSMVTHAEDNGVEQIKISVMAQKFSDPAFRGLIDTAFDGSSVSLKMINATCKINGGC